jgi:cell division protein FtsN
VSKDYKKAERNPGSRGTGGSLLVGILIGLVLGLSIALGVAWYINRMPSPFLARSVPPPKPGPQADTRNESKADDRSAKAAVESKPRFDFYKILPGEQPATDQQFRDAQKTPATAVEREIFFLQAGAFPNATDADNLKARLALLGVEATIQTATLPDKGVWHRVRIGPYASIEELNRARDTLKQNGYDTSLIKMQDTERSRQK